METEQMLLRQLSEEDTASLEALIDRYTPYVFAVLRRNLGGFACAEDLEELASNVFFSLWQHRKRLRSGQLRAWLSRVAANEAKSWLRRQRLKTISAEDWFELPDSAAAGLEDTAIKQALAERALSLLDPETREIFLRYYRDRQTLPEIAAALGQKVPTVKSRLQRGRKLLKNELEGEFL